MHAKTAKPRRFDRDVDGVILLDKPKGISSNAALQQARVIFRAIKAGHAGSLDPMATGMLPVCFGQATKACAYLLDAFKTYRFVMRLGERTDTADADGTVVERQAIPALSTELIQAALAVHIGDQFQVPPMYSALKHEGERLYEIARRGETIDRPARAIRVTALTLGEITANEMEITVRCSKGTYVRTLAEDIAKTLGTVAHLTALRRLQVDPFLDSQMTTLDQLHEIAATGADALDKLLMPVDRALLHFGTYSFDTSGQDRLIHGQSASGTGGGVAGETVRMYGPDRHFLGLGEVLTDGLVQPRRLLAKSEAGQAFGETPNC